MHAQKVIVCLLYIIDTKASTKISCLLTNPRLLKDIARLSPKYQTSSLESFHSVLIHFAPKSVAFSFNGMLCRLVQSAYFYSCHH